MILGRESRRVVPARGNGPTPHGGLLQEALLPERGPYW